MPTIDFYFEFVSPYSYLAAKAIGALAAKHRREVRWLPVDLPRIWQGHNVLDAYGGVRNLKKHYVFKDASMVAKSRGIAMTRPVRFANAGLAKLAVHHLNMLGHDRGAAFGMAVWDRYFGRGDDISSEDDLLHAAADKISPAELKAAAASEPARQAFDKATETAGATGCFGVPWLIVDGEPFFGQDRLELIDWWLSRRG